jgi:hypothetical protein
MLELLNQPVEVLSYFTEGRVQPLRFRWRGRVVRIRRVTGEWTRQEGVGRVHYFSVLAENSDYFELAYDLDQASWRLCRVWVEG